ncbi:hypothetical protein HBN50_03725 [Halobacteriovorax sp. GB3]|uniref:hypothetical protein n=1 Tax=Halobacteriovorax sp. GB3 TaxID=2719615 RepID=UPI002361A076|nr:hypothetical protein [Halobacteriovorax sp. GB3]MDD0852188.1 hypothetical protein [Halobacteriovorax sp. GB3]
MKMLLLTAILIPSFSWATVQSDCDFIKKEITLMEQRILKLEKEIKEEQKDLSHILADLTMLRQELETPITNPRAIALLKLLETRSNNRMELIEEKKKLHDVIVGQVEQYEKGHKESCK